MEIREISIFKEFKCQGSDCPDTCCRGWVIPLTAEDRKRILTEPGLLKLRVGLAMLGKRLGDFNSACRVCPFLGRDKLCKLQKAKGHDFIPETCRTYPRSYRNYGEFEERFVDLSCIKAAELFIANYDKLDFVTSEGDPVSDLYGTNEDSEYLHSLSLSRGLLIDGLRKTDCFDTLSDTLLMIDDYAWAVQDAFIHGDTDFTDKNPFDSFCKDTAKTGAGDHASRVFPLTEKQIRSIFDTGLFHEYLKYGSPYIYDILKLYVDHKSRWYTREAVEELYREYVSACPDRICYYSSYYIYYLYKFYMNCYEDYSFVRNVRIGFIHLGIIFLLHALYHHYFKELPMKEFTHIISAYNKRAYFNYSNLDKMYEAVAF